MKYIGKYKSDGKDIKPGLEFSIRKRYARIEIPNRDIETFNKKFGLLSSWRNSVMKELGRVCGDFEVFRDWAGYDDGYKLWHIWRREKL